VRSLEIRQKRCTDQTLGVCSGIGSAKTISDLMRFVDFISIGRFLQTFL
jgi:hypothetical protein